MKTLRTAVTLIVATTSFLACGGGAGEPLPGVATDDLSVSCSWKQVSSPNVGMSDNSLASVAGESETSIWAVGSVAPDSNPDITQTLVQHFDGTRWSVIPSPNVGTQANALNGVTALSERAIAVGFYIDDHTFTTQSLIERWDGHHWEIISHPHSGTTDFLAATSAASLDDIWAVGYQTDAEGRFSTLTEHFDGRAWSIVPSPNPGSLSNQLYGVEALSTTDVWAVGGRVDAQAPDQALILHWTGDAWSVVAAPVDGALSTNLFAVAASSASSTVQAVGDAKSNRSGSRALVEEGNTHWKIENAPSEGSNDNHLYGIDAKSSNVGWAVGSFMDPAGDMKTLVLAGGLSGWSRVASPSPSGAGGDSVLGSVAVVGANDAWAVGAFDGPNALQTLVLHCH